MLAAGFAAIVVLLLARVAWPAWRQASARLSAEHGAARMPGRRPRAADWLARSGAPVTAVTGVRLALDPGRGRGAVPVRSALLGTALSATAVAAAVTFGANLLHLVNTPRLYGQDWDVSVDLQFGTITPQQFDALAARVPGISGWTFGLHGTVGIGGAVVPAIGLAAGRGPADVADVAGRPRARGRSTRSCSVPRCSGGLGLRVGQSVPVTAERPASELAGSWAARSSPTSARAASRRPTSARAR